MSHTFVRGSLAAVIGVLLAFGMSGAWAKQEQNIKNKNQLSDLEKVYDEPVKERKKTSGLSCKT